MLTPKASKARALPSPSAPAKTSTDDTNSTSTKPACLMESRYSPSRRAPPIQAVHRSTLALAGSGTGR